MCFSPATTIALAQILEQITDITLQIQQLSSLDAIFTCAVDRTRAILHSDRVVIYRFSAVGQGAISAESADSQHSAHLSQLIEKFDCQASQLDSYQQRQSYVIEDIYTHALPLEHLELFKQAQIRASLATPILSHHQLWGLVIAYQCHHPRRWQPLELQLLQQISLQLGIAIQQHDLNQSAQQTISHLPNSDRSLQLSEVQHRAIVEDQTEVIARFLPDSTVLFVNEAYCRYFGISRSDMIGKSYHPVIYQPDREAVIQKLQLLSAENPTVTIENRVINAQGEIRWTQWVNRRLINERGEVEFQTVGRDITELKRTEERFRVVQELSLDAFTILKSVRDHTGKIIDFEWTYANPKAAEVLKRPISELVGQRLLAVLPGNQQNSELFQQYVRVVETGIPHDIELFYDAEGITDWFRNMAVKLEDGIAISFSNITQRKQTEAALRDSTAQLQTAVTELQQLNRTKDEFLSMVSHELRTPMTNIKMSVRMLALSLAPPPSPQQEQKITQYLQILSQECDREINLINDLLDLQQLEAGKKQTTLEPIDFHQWLVTFIQPFQERTVERQQRLVLEFFSHDSIASAAICFDLKSLERIVSELLNNACKYTPPGQQIIVTAQRLPEHLDIQVTNFGVEIPAQALPHIFDRFYRVPSGDPWKQGGTGLGLALIKKLVEHLNGSIQVESGSGRTCFDLTLAIPPPQDSS